MESDTEKLIKTYNWKEETERIKNIEKEISDIVYKINNNNEQLNSVDKETLTKELKEKIDSTKQLLEKYEMELTNSEVKGDSSEVIKEREDQYILLSKEYERIENIANIDAIGKQNSIGELSDSNKKGKFIKDTTINISHDEDEEELLQLQEILLDEQDKNLDILEDVIKRHQEIGLAINSEIDAQIDLFETTEDDLQDTQRRLDRTRRRIDQVGKLNELISCRLIVIIIILLLILIIIKYSL